MRLLVTIVWILTHHFRWTHQAQIATITQTTFSNTFSSTQIVGFWNEFRWRWFLIVHSMFARFGLRNASSLDLTESNNFLVGQRADRHFITEDTSMNSGPCLCQEGETNSSLATKQFLGLFTKRADFSQLRDLCLDFSNRSAIWHTRRKQRCQNACQISEQYNHYYYT